MKTIEEVREFIFNTRNTIEKISATYPLGTTRRNYFDNRYALCNEILDYIDREDTE
jgi:hypothetical protein